MNESFIDACQNALADCAVSLGVSFGLEFSIKWARLLTFVINIPIMIIALQGYNVTSLFLIACLATTTSCVPILIGLIPALDNYVREASVLFGTVFSLMAIAIYGYVREGTFVGGIYRSFFQSYEWQTFLIAFFGSIVGIFIAAFVDLGWRRVRGIQYTFRPKHKMVDTKVIEKECMVHSEVSLSHISMESISK
jgi:hypothetical protein